MSLLNVLTFHKIENLKSCEHAVITKAMFQAIIKTCKQLSLKVITTNDLCFNTSSYNYKAKSYIIFTFDDGFKSDFEIATPLLINSGFYGVFFIVNNKVGEKGFMSWAQIIELSKLGMEIGSHSYSHSFLSMLSCKKLYAELYKSRCEIEDKIGKKVKAISFPYGDYNKTVLRVAEEVGFEFFFTSNFGINKFPLNKKNIKRNKIHKNIKKQQVFSLLFPSQKTIFLKTIAFEIKDAIKYLLTPKYYTKIVKVIKKPKNDFV